MQVNITADDPATTGLVCFLFAIFTADWAHTTRRNPWLWFFLGLCFAPITGLALLYKNGQDRKSADADRSG
jgi:hypothetical protein